MKKLSGTCLQTTFPDTTMHSVSRHIFLFIFSVISLTGFAQYRLSIVVNDFPASGAGEPFYVAGSMNQWNPADSNYRLSYNSNAYMLSISDVRPGQYSFKFTRGNWKAVETTADGSDVSDRVVTIQSDTTIYCSIAGWKNDFQSTLKVSTSSAQVHVLPDSFFMPGLNRYRKIRVYIPKDYKKNTKRYPVMYMHDGQNLFDDADAPYGEWRIDETLDSLISLGHPPCIIVGIDNGPQRINEYLPFDSDEYGKAEGDDYLSFIVTVIKPYIDKRYRSLPGKEHTYIAGSSLGGLISYYAMLRYPSVFGNAGIFSPSFWIAPDISQCTDSLGRTITGKMFFYIGEQEGRKHVDLMRTVADMAGEKSKAIIYTVTDPLASHNETAWRKWFPEFYLWIMGDGFNRQVKTKH